MSALLRAAAAGLLALMLLFGLAHVFLRFFYGGGLIWYGEIARFFQVWMIFLALPLLTVRGNHVAISFKAVENMGGIKRSLLSGAVSLLLVGFFLVFIWHSARMTWNIASQSFITMPGVSLAWGYAAAPVGMSMVLVAYVARLLGRRRHGKE